MELKRDIYDELLDWKKKNTGKVLELEGARQVGKTWILQKFSKEYKHSVYINMLAFSGEQFLKCLDAATAWEPGQERIEKPIHKALLLYDKGFLDDKDTLVVIDEIQDSAKVYSMIRQFAREFEAHFIVTGSYLGRTLEKGFFLSAGDTDSLQMEPLTFPEFLEALGKRTLYESVDLYGASNHAVYDELKKYFDDYLFVGGYPEAVKVYLEKGRCDAVTEAVVKVVDIFAKESKKYFNSELELDIFEKLFTSIAINLVKEKKGTSDLVTELSKIVFKEESNRVTKKAINGAISWLYLSHQIGYAGKCVDCNINQVVENCRYYFSDCGVANYFLDTAGYPRETTESCLCENFVYLELVRRIRKREIAGLSPWFGTDEATSGELDFFVRSRKDYKNYGMEVKRGNEIARTGNVLLEKGKLDYLYNLKDTYGGIEGKKYAVPLYLAGRVSFDLGKEE